MQFLLLPTAESESCGCSSDGSLIAGIVVLAILLFISLTGHVIVAVWIFCHSTQRRTDTVKQDVPLQENVAYAMGQRRIEQAVPLKDKVAYYTVVK